MEIVRATPKHCRRVVALAKEGGIFNYTLPFYSLLVALGWIYVVRDLSGAVVAYTCYAVIPGAKAAFNFQTAVAASHRGKKLGGKLFTFLEQELKRRYRIKLLYAHCLKPRVVKLLKRLGWEVAFRTLGVAFVQKRIP